VQLQSLQVDFSQAPITIDIELVRDLRCKLHSEKKCFTGKQFVDSLLAMNTTAEDSTVSSPSSDILQGHRLDYGCEYATDLGQYLLDCGLLTVAGTASHHLVHTPSPSEIDSSIERHNQPMKRAFQLLSLYKFSEAEDTDFNLRKHQVFLSVTEKMNKRFKRSQQQQHQQMPVEERARLGTLLLVSDILLQRSRHDRRLKDFVKSNRFVDVSRELASNEINCLYIVHL